MADQQQLAILKQGVQAWNAWRRQEGQVIANLVRADLHRFQLGRGINLSGANLRHIDFSQAKLGRANLSEADLTGADLSEAELAGSKLARATLCGADLRRADLHGADLSGANLTSAKLVEANLSSVTLIGADLRGAELYSAELRGANLADAELSGSDLSEANLAEARLIGAHLFRADLDRANLSRANLERAALNGANLLGAYLIEAHLIQAELVDAKLSDSYLTRAKLTGANLTNADLIGTNLVDADLREANLSGANLRNAILIRSRLGGAILSGCKVFGISAWNVELESAIQTDLSISDADESEITVDHLEMAQFLYLLLHNDKIRDAIDTITSKVVLIIGRFTPERKVVLDALREALRQCNYVPVLFDFSGPESRDITETVTLLARMARFIIADLTEPASVPQELQAFVPDVMVPVQPLIAKDATPNGMLGDLHSKYHWMLPTYRYSNLDTLLHALPEQVIAPAEAKAHEVRKLRQEQEAEM